MLRPSSLYCHPTCRDSCQWQRLCVASSWISLGIPSHLGKLGCSLHVQPFHGTQMWNTWFYPGCATNPDLTHIYSKSTTPTSSFLDLLQMWVAWICCTSAIYRFAVHLGSCGFGADVRKICDKSAKPKCVQICKMHKTHNSGTKTPRPWPHIVRNSEFAYMWDCGCGEKLGEIHKKASRRHKNFYKKRSKKDLCCRSCDPILKS
jgi:hypothetical protein